MNSKRFLVAICTVFVAALLIQVARSALELRALRPKATKFDERCGQVRTVLVLDLQSLADPQQAAETAHRFGIEAGQSDDEILMCATAPVDLSRRPLCVGRGDLKCVEQLVRASHAVMR